MRIAVLSDIHGNLLALDACLADLEAQGGADAIAVAGDLCLPGPKPKKVLQRLEELGAACIRGNKDRFLCDGASDGEQSADRSRPDRLDSPRTRRTLALVAARTAVCDAHRRGRQPAARSSTPIRRTTTSTSGPTPTRRRSSGSSARSARRRSPSATCTFPTCGCGAAGCWSTSRRPECPKTAIRAPATRSSPSATGGWEVKHRRVAFDVKKVATQLADCGIPESAELIATLRRHRYKQLKKLDPDLRRRGRPARQAVRQLHRRRRYLAARRSGRVLRLSRPERRRQDDDDQRDRRACAQERGQHSHLRLRQRARVAAGAAAHRAFARKSTTSTATSRCATC